MNRLIYICILLVSYFPVAASAKCSWKGNEYDEGDIANDRVCVNGSWVGKERKPPKTNTGENGNDNKKSD